MIARFLKVLISLNILILLFVSSPGCNFQQAGRSVLVPANKQPLAAADKMVSARLQFKFYFTAVDP